MSLNNSALFRTATRFRQLFVGPVQFKGDATGYGTRADRVTATFKGGVSQTANIVEIHDSSANVIGGFAKDGQVIEPVSGLTLPRVAHAIYSFAVDGGAIGLITPVKTAVIPANAILLGGCVNVPTAVTSAGSATVSVGTSAGSSASALLAATAKASLSIDALINLVPVFATPVKMTAAGSITLTVATAALTAGVIEVFALYVIPANA